MHEHVAFVVSTRIDFLRHMFEVVRLFTVIYLQRNTLDKLLGLCKIKIEKVLPIDG